MLHIEKMWKIRHRWHINITLVNISHIDSYYFFSQCAILKFQYRADVHKLYVCAKWCCLQNWPLCWTNSSTIAHTFEADTWRERISAGTEPNNVARWNIMRRFISSFPPMLTEWTIQPLDIERDSNVAAMLNDCREMPSKYRRSNIYRHPINMDPINIIDPINIYAKLSRPT